MFSYRRELLGRGCQIRYALIVALVGVVGSVALATEPVALAQPDGSTLVSVPGGDESFNRFASDASQNLRAPVPVGQSAARQSELKWEQLPDLDPTGFDVFAQYPPGLGVVTADDFLCTQTGPITEIQVWGSWLEDYLPGGDPTNVSFIMSLHADIPVGPHGWSIPGEVLWMWEFHPEDFIVEAYATGLEEGFYDPSEDYYIPFADTICWLYTFPMPVGQNGFIQEGTETEPVIYWLDLQAFPFDESYFGWKTSADHWNDDAVWGLGVDPPAEWIELRYPSGHPWVDQSIDLAFAIIGESTVCEPLPDGSGCRPYTCAASLEECQAACMNYDPVTGQTAVIDCECRALGGCHAEVGALPSNPCELPDNGTGTATLPPIGCEYESPDEKWMIIDGLPPGTTIEMEGILMNFICTGAHPFCSMALTPGQCETAGGSLGGDGDCFEAALDLTVTGTGSLAGFNRHLWVSMFGEVHTGPRNPGDPVQAFPSDMYRFRGQLFGDPDFCEFIVTAGTDFGLPGPGQTTLIELPGGDYAVDSFFDVMYFIDFEGCPGSQLEGYAGTTLGSIRIQTGGVQAPPTCVGDCQLGEECVTTEMVQGDGSVDICCDCVESVCEPMADGSACKPGTCEIAGEECEPKCVKFDPGTGVNTVEECECHEAGDCHVDLASGVPYPCEQPNNGTGTATLPPIGCEYESPDEKWMIIDGLPPDTTIEMEGPLTDFFCNSQPGPRCSMALSTGDCETTGGSLGGLGHCFEATLDLEVTGTGSLAGFNRHLAVPMFVESHTGMRNPGDPVQAFPSDMYRVFGELFGDPDFCTLRVTAGTDYGLPGPGYTTLTELPSGDFAVDSFFDVMYFIEFEGCPGSQLEDYSGTTLATIRIETGTMSPPVCTGDCPLGYRCDTTETPGVGGTIDVCCNCVEADCEPLPDASGCWQGTCDLPGEECLSACADLDLATGDTAVTTCECRDGDACHVDPATADADRPCTVPDNGGGTGDLPPYDCEYQNPDEVWEIVDGFPPGTTIELDTIFMNFYNIVRGDGGSLGGQYEQFDSTLDMTVTGTGDLAGFNRHLAVPTFCVTHSAPRTAGHPVQALRTELYRMSGALYGDPDFCALYVRAGVYHGLPSPGYTVLTELPSGDFAVDSFFDITYQIEFEGCPGSELEYYAGTTTRTIRMPTGAVSPTCDGGCQTGELCVDTTTPGSGGSLEVCCDCLGDVCGPKPDGTACLPATCVEPGDECQPSCARFDTQSGQNTVLTCECREPDACRVDVLSGAVHPCIEPDNGTGTATLPPEDCSYASPDDKWRIIDGLPPGTTVELDGVIEDFINIVAVNGGSLGGQKEQFDATLDAPVSGTGSLAGFNRHISVALTCETHSASRNPGDPVQSFATDWFRLQGELFGDPDFCTFRIRGGTDYGLSSHGHTTLTELPSGDFAVDSFFDITYQIEFEGCPDSQLADYAGTTQGTIRVETGRAVAPNCIGDCPFGYVCDPTVTPNGDGTIDVCCNCVELDCEPMPDGSACQPALCPQQDEVCRPGCVEFDLATGQTDVTACECRDQDECHVDPATADTDRLCTIPDNGSGTGDLPPAWCEYHNPDEMWEIIEGFPPDTTVELDTIFMDFYNVVRGDGGSLGGRYQQFDATLDMTVTGTGELSGFNRHIAVPAVCETHSSPRTPGDPVQSFRYDMFSLYGQLFGDPDFCEFIVTAGVDYSLPSPGQATLTELPSGDFAVDSFFDITYQIEFQGCPGSQLDGYAGMTFGTIRMPTGVVEPTCVGGCLEGEICQRTETLGSGGMVDICCECVPDAPDQPDPPPGEPGYDKVRYISFVPSTPGVQTAIRVTLTTMPPPYAGFSGQQMWVGEALEKCENGGVSSPPCPPVPLIPDSFQTANLQCTPNCMDYGSVGALHVTDDEIIPNAVYDVQMIDCSSDFGNEANYSDPLTIGTTLWGDLVGDCTVIPCSPADGIVNVTTDVTAVLDKFKNLPAAVMKSRADLDPNLPEWLVNITDVTFCLDAFLGFTYPPFGWAGPGGCGPTGARVESYSNSGCLGSRDQSSTEPCVEDDVIELTPSSGTLDVTHWNASYNCCQDDIKVSSSLEGSLLSLTEEEVPPGGLCFCVCCFNVEARVVDLPAGEYTVEYCWLDYEQGSRCHTDDIVIP